MVVEHGVDHGADEVMPLLALTGRRIVISGCMVQRRELLMELVHQFPDGVHQVNHSCCESVLPMQCQGLGELAAIFPPAHGEGHGLGEDLCMRCAWDRMPVWKLTTRAGWDEDQVVKVLEQCQGFAARGQVQLRAVRQVPQDCGTMAAGIDGAEGV